MMKEIFSAWVDGEGELPDSAPLTEAQREDWQMCHLIGDAMRGDVFRSARTDQSHHQNMTAAIMVQLAQEPVVLAPQKSRRSARVAQWAVTAAACLSAAGLVVGLAVTQGRGGVGQSSTDVSLSSSASNTLILPHGAVERVNAPLAEPAHEPANEQQWQSYVSAHDEATGNVGVRRAQLHVIRAPGRGER